MSEVVVVIGAGLIGQARARRVSAGKRVVLGDLHQGSAAATAEYLLDVVVEESLVLHGRGLGRVEPRLNAEPSSRSL